MAKCWVTTTSFVRRGPTRLQPEFLFSCVPHRNGDILRKSLVKAPLEFRTSCLPSCAGIDIPETCIGKSLLPIMQGDTDRIRKFLHGEHAGCYAYNHGNHYVTDGCYKYIWYSQMGKEHLFNLEADPHETHDISREPDAEKCNLGETA